MQDVNLLKHFHGVALVLTVKQETERELLGEPLDLAGVHNLRRISEVMFGCVFK